MSQVKKLASGGTTTTTLFFDAAGRKINKNDLVYVAKKNLDALLYNNNINGDDAVAVTNAYNDLVQNIDSGNISSMDLRGTFTDNSGLIRQTEDGSYGKAASMLSQLISLMGASKDSASANKPKVRELTDIINENFFGGNYSNSSADLKLWNDLNGKSKLADYIDEYANELATADPNDKKIDRLKNASATLRKGNYDTEAVQALVSAGIPSAAAYSLMGVQVDPTTEELQSETTDPVKLREDWIKAKTEEYVKAGTDATKARAAAESEYDAQVKKANEAADKVVSDNDYNNWYEGITNGFTDSNFSVDTGNNFNIDWYDANKGGSVSDRWIDVVDSALKNKGFTLLQLYSSQTTDAHRRQIRALLQLEARFALNNQSDTMTHLGNGMFLLNYYTNYKKGYAWVYDANNLQVRKVKTSDIEYLDLKNRDYYTKTYQKHEEGGVIQFMRSGKGILSLKGNQEATRQAYFKARNAEIAKSSGKTEAQIAHDSKSIKEFDLAGSDGVRLGAAIADLAGAVAAFVPGGSAVSLIQGIASDAARAGADVADGATWGQAGLNFAKGLGMTVVSSLPIVGTGGKLGKAMKGVKTFLPWALSAYSTLSTAGPAYKSLQKIESGKGTLEDYTKILTFLTAVTNTSKTAGNAMKAHAIKKAASTGEIDATIKGKNGDIHLNKAKLEELKTCTSRAEMQAKIKTLTGDESAEIDFGHFNGLNPLSYSLKPSGKHFWNQGAGITEAKQYDFNTIKGKYDSDVNMLGFKLNSPNWLSRLIPNFSFGYNPGKVTTQPQSAVPTTSRTQPQTVADPDDILAGTVAAEKHGGRLTFVLAKYKTGGIIKMQLGNTAPINFADLLLLNKTYYDENGNLKTSLLTGISNKPEDIRGHSSKGTLWGNDSKGHFINTGKDVNEYYQLYFGNRDNIQHDLDYLTNTALNNGKFLVNGLEFTGETFRDWYNAKVKSMNSKRNEGKFTYNDNTWSDYNDAFNTIYSGANANLYGFDDKLKQYHGTSTVHRVPLNFKNEYANASAEEQKARQFTTKVGGKDVTYYYNADGTIELLPQEQSQEKVTPTQVQPQTAQTQPVQLKSGINVGPYLLNGLKDALLIRKLLTNDKIADLYKDLPITKNPDYKVAPVADVYNMYANAARQAGQSRNIARQLQNSTSDGIAGMNAVLQSEKNIATNIWNPTNTAIDNKMLTYADKAVDVANYNKQQEIETGNWNNASLTENANNNNHIDAQKLTANDASITGRENEVIKDIDTEVKEAKAYKKSNDSQQIQRQAQLDMLMALSKDNEYNNAYQNYQAAIASNNTVDAAYWKKVMDNKAMLYKVNALNQQGAGLAGIYGYSYTPLNYQYQQVYDQRLPVTTGVKVSKNGGTLEDNIFKAKLEDNKRFDKGILEMIKRNQKAINDSNARSNMILEKLMSKFSK